MNEVKKVQIPQSFQPFLWSYDLSKIDKDLHKDIIIKNVLDIGDRYSTNWVRENYTDDEIKDVIIHSSGSDWSKKSINFWTLIYDVVPERQNRF